MAAKPQLAKSTIGFGTRDLGNNEVEVFLRAPQGKASETPGRTSSRRQGSSDVIVVQYFDGALAEAEVLSLDAQSPRFESRTFRTLWSHAFDAKELDELVIPARTFSRRLARKEPLTVEETDRALRLARISVEADRVFGAHDKAAQWLRRPNAGFRGHTPLSLLKTELGSKAVEERLIQIEHGIFS